MEKTPDKTPDDSSIEAKLGEILRDAGLITEDVLEDMMEKYKSSEESFANLLKQEISLKSLKDLLTTEIPLPFLKNRKEAEVRDILTGSGIITDEELRLALDENGSEEDLGKILVRRGIIEEAQLEDAKKEMARTGMPLWRTLLALKLVTHAAIADLMKLRIGHGTTHAREEFLIDIFLNRSLIQPEQVERATIRIESEGGSILTKLIEHGDLSVQQVAETLEEAMDIPLVDITRHPPDPSALFLIPVHVMKARKILPLKVEDTHLKLGMLNPLDEESIHKAQFITGYTVQPCWITSGEWERAMDELGTTRPADGAGSELQNRLRDDAPSGIALTEDMSAVQVASAIIDGSINARATDIHLEPQEPEMRVRYRIDSMMYDVMSIPRNLELPVISRLKLLSNMDITEKRRPLDGHFSMKIKDREFNFRTATIPTYLGEKMTIRILDERRVLRGVQQLGLETEELQRLSALTRKSSGMIVVTGPIGSGKTTTLYAALNETNLMNRHAITIEDPVEYRLAGVNQVQVNMDIGLDFRAGLRAILRHDADIIMVGEIRDGETAKVATWAALTGQLVFCTLHTVNAAGAITMLRNLGVEDYLISNSIMAVIGQRLVRRLCPSCRTMEVPESHHRVLFNLTSDDNLKVGNAVGCHECFHTGYKGMTGIYEILEVSSEIQKLIVNQASREEIEAAAVADGMRTMQTNAVAKIVSGITTPEEVLREIPFKI